MARILSIQSQVIYGHVGNSAAAFVLQRLGHEVLAIPTTLLAHHPGHRRIKGEPISPKRLADWLEELDARGWLNDCNAVLTGYFASADQIKPVADVIRRLKKTNPDLLYLCDPVFGDVRKGNFLPKDVPAAIQKYLLPLADLATPNAFEISELTKRKVRERETAFKAATELGPPNVFVTSVPLDSAGGTAEIGTLAWQKPGDWTRPGGLQKTGSWLVSAPHRKQVPHGTGDVFAALLLGHMLNQLPVPASLRRAVASVGDLISTALTSRSDELPIVEKQDALLRPSSMVSLTPLGAGAEGQWVAGVDDCPRGWLVVLTDLSGHTPARFRLCNTFAEVLDLQERPSVIAVDVPIGLPDVAGRGGRKCDTAARSRLGARRSAVFTPPSRAALAEDNFRTACEVNLKHSIPPRKVSKQTFGIFPKIREVDAALDSDDQVRIFACHPEVAFWAMNGERPLAIPKKIKNVPHGEGLALRRSLLAASGFDVKFLASFDMSRLKAGQDDFLDACACAYAAQRIAKGEAVQMPQEPDRDGRGLRMEIWG